LGGYGYDGGLGTSAVIYVPAAAADAYKNAAGWEEHTDRIQAMETYK
jgi:hypothetical protein